MTQRYSPEPLAAYKHAAMFKFLVEDPQAWDLAYLSWPFESGMLPDPHFGVNCRRTLQFVMGTGKLDIASQLPTSLTLRSLMKGPAPQAVKLILSLKRLKETPMYLAYGEPWAETLMKRSRLYREPYDAEYDFEVKSVANAAEVIAKVK